jgi:predicted transcriptional regulator of viral defense system
MCHVLSSNCYRSRLKRCISPRFVQLLMPGPIYKTLAELAADRYGYITTADAAEAGIDPHRLLEMAKRGHLERAATGVYRVLLIPPTPLDPYMLATLWPRQARGVISHESALDLHGLSDVNPNKIHITVPPGHRPRREIPRLYVLHHEALAPDEVTAHEGVPIVTAAKAIRQAQATHLGPALIGQAIGDGRRRGLLTRQEAEELERELGLLATTRV